MTENRWKHPINLLWAIPTTIIASICMIAISAIALIINFPVYFFRANMLSDRSIADIAWNKALLNNIIILDKYGKIAGFDEIAADMGKKARYKILAEGDC
jgi:hypothetical protein